MNPLVQLTDLGQSIWYDYIRRDLLTTGALTRMIEQDHLRGMTSNPSIFDAAIAKSDLYDDDIRNSADDMQAIDIFERIAVAEIRHAADLFRTVYDATTTRDGYVSLEVAPTLARDTQGTIAEARRLWRACGRDNVMIKIPGTAEGLPAIETCLAEGININVTLLFSSERYVEVMEAWLRALERRVASGQPIDRIASVASFFVSRVDGMVDKALKDRQKSADPATARRIAGLLSTFGVHNARLAYQAYETTIARSARFARLKAKGAQVQRPLWASTSTKDPALSDVLYVEQLIAPDSVNTVPPNTYEAFKDHGSAKVRIHDQLDQAHKAFATLEELGIDFAAIATELEDDGVAKFSKSFDDLLKSIVSKREQIQTT